MAGTPAIYGTAYTHAASFDTYTSNLTADLRLVSFEAFLEDPLIIP